MVHRWETKILRLPFRPKMQTGEEWEAYKARTARMLRTRWKKLGLPSLAELCAEKVWKTMAWAVHEGEVPVLKALRFVIGWRTTAWWRNKSAWGMKWDPLNITCWKHKWGFHNRGVAWDTPLARRAGSGEDWIQKWRMNPPKKTEAVPALVRAIRLSPLHIKKTEGGIPHRKGRELDPLVTEPPRTVDGIELVIRGDSKTVVDLINGKAKQKVSYRAIEIIQIQLMEWWKMASTCAKGGDWAVHIFREHNKEADLWAGFGAKGISMEWNDESAIDWTSVTGICGFWVGSCTDKVCGAGITFSFFTQRLGWVIRYEKCGPVEGSNSLDAELGGCAMLIESLKFWLQKAESRPVVVEI